jgi:hypothetical protein
LFSLASLFVGGFTLLLWALSQTQITTAAYSPDGQHRADLVDRKLHMIDRNFRIRIVELSGSSQFVFHSPDENPLNIGQERFLWSQDGRRLLLVGRGFWVRKGAELANGESLYFLWDAASGKSWCNSDQRGPPFDITELEGFDFGENLELKSVEEQFTSR